MGSTFKIFPFRLDSEQRHLDEQAMRQNVPKITLDKNIQVSYKPTMFLIVNLLHSIITNNERPLISLENRSENSIVNCKFLHKNGGISGGK